MTKGVYQLLIKLDKTAMIQVGKLGEFTFPKGYYIYTGSAMGGLEARIARHLSKSKRFHWHIDYLLQQSNVIIHGSRACSEKIECEISRQTLEMDGASMPVPGFGSSDCKCISHLVYFKKKPKLAV